mgnify:CR=1 FL=1
MWNELVVARKHTFNLKSRLRAKAESIGGTASSKVYFLISKSRSAEFLKVPGAPSDCCLPAITLPS